MTSRSGHVYVARRLTDAAMTTLAETAPDHRVGGEEPPARADLLAGCAGAAAAIVTLTERVDAEFFDTAGPQLKVVANVAVGYDNIDLAEAARRGVVVTNTPGVLDAATADHTLAMILALGRRVVEADRFVRSGQPWTWGPRSFVGLDISAGAVLGIIGFGRIGRAVARRALAFDMEVVAYHPRRLVGDAVDGVTMVGLPDLLGRSDVVSLHVPLKTDTRHLIGAPELAAMKEGALLVNAARGGVVDEAALIDAVRSGRLSGAALDTFEGEPHVNPALGDLPNVVLTPHIASAGGHTRDRMCLLALQNVSRVLAGHGPVTPVIPPTTLV